MSQSNLLETLDRSDRIWHLSRTGLLEGLGPEDLEAVILHLEDRVYAEGRVIFNPGESAQTIYFLNRGSARLSLVPDDHREKTVEILKGGDVFGVEAMRESGRYEVRAEAHEESWISLLPRQDFIQLAGRHPALCNNLIQLLLEKLAHAHDEIKALCFLDIEQRLIQALLRLARKHGHRLANRNNMVRLQLRLSHDYLARLTGANRPYLSNIMSSLRKQGLIQYQRKHLLIDFDALNSQARSGAQVGRVD